MADGSPSCPLPLGVHPHVLLAHGGGGKLMQDLVEQIFRPAFRNELLDQRHDGAVFELGGQRVAFTTDSYVVRPLFFPGGDIGSLAVNGTVNDLAMCGARPLFLSAGFVIEEGLPMETLQRVAQSMRDAALRAGVLVVTGDTKVVDRGKGDGLYLNTAGIGVLEHARAIGPQQVAPGDAILVSGDIGRHGTAIMAQREGLAFESTIESDCAPLNGLVRRLLDGGIEVHCLRDLTRGGLAAALVEIARDRGLRVHVESRSVPVREDVRGACELLGLDPMYVANEGRLVAFVPEAQAGRAADLMRGDPEGSGSCRIGRVLDEARGLVTLSSEIGVTRVLDLLSGEQLPRIC